MQVATTPKQIEYFRLAALKARVKLEAAGIKFKGRSVTAAMRREFGLSARAPHSAVIDLIQSKMEAILQCPE